MKKPSELSVLIAGSGAVRAHPERGGPAFIATINGQNLLFDCGRCAIHNMSRFGVPVETIAETYITHLHFDHICDLPLLLLLSWNNGRTRRMPIYGPKGIDGFLENGLRQAYTHDINSRAGHGKDVSLLDWDVTELTKEGIVRETETFKIDTLVTKHGGLLNINYRLTTADKVIVIMSDSEYDPRIEEFCRNADLVLIECSGTQEFLDTVPWGSWHMIPEQIGEIMSKAKAKKIVLKHLVIESFRGNDMNISERMAETAQKIYPDGKFIAATDGMKLEL